MQGLELWGPVEPGAKYQPGDCEGAMEGLAAQLPSPGHRYLQAHEDNPKAACEARPRYGMSTDMATQMNA